MLVALSNPHTPSTLDTNTICVQFAIPVDAAIRAAWLQFAAYLGNPDNWQKDGVIEQYECAALIAGMIETGLNTPCVEPGGGGAMQYLTDYNITSGDTEIIIELPSEFESVVIRGTLSAPSTANLNLRANFDTLEPTSGYRWMVTQNDGINVVGTSSNQAFMAIGVGGISRSSQTPPYSWLDAIVSDHWKPGQHSQFHGTLVNANSAEKIDFAANNQVLRADGYLMLYPSSSTFGSGRLQTWGISGA